MASVHALAVVAAPRRAERARGPRDEPPRTPGEQSGEESRPELSRKSGHSSPSAT